MSEEFVHLTTDDEHGSGKLLCTGTWISVLWGDIAYVRKDLGLGGGIYRADDEDKNIYQYTFADPVATCQKCIDKRCQLLAKKNQAKIDEFMKRNKPL